MTATDRREARTVYSNQSVKRDRLAVAAPGGSSLGDCGENVVSTVPAGTSGRGAACGYGRQDGAYDERSGTSMAAPHVAGVAALLKAQGRSYDDVIRALVSTARNPVTGARGTWDPAYGYGIVDAAAAVAAPRPR